jgi:hypothetical protein
VTGSSLWSKTPDDDGRTDTNPWTHFAANTRSIRVRKQKPAEGRARCWVPSDSPRSSWDDTAIELLQPPPTFRRKPYEVWWRVGMKPQSKSFLISSLSDNFRSDLLQAAKRGEHG